MQRSIHQDNNTGRLRRCAHATAIAFPVEPFSNGCPACQKQGTGWVDLWLCLSCGWVACDEHAKAHYQQTDHPVAALFLDVDGFRQRWCYVHQRVV
jgi:uncharacterized UBP type Zn finger protein